MGQLLRRITNIGASESRGDAMRHTRAEVIKRATREFKALDRLVAKLTPAQWKRLVPRPETKDPWTVKDVLAHITYWKEGVALSARGQRRPGVESKLGITARNRLIHKRWRARTAKEVLAWHRQVHKDLLAALREAPTAWFARPSRSASWPFDLDGHSAEHRLQDISRAVQKPKK
jgi:uncharacterized protein (TIGR03083 family)